MLPLRVLKQKFPLSVNEAFGVTKGRIHLSLLHQLGGFSDHLDKCDLSDPRLEAGIAAKCAMVLVQNGIFFKFLEKKV